MAHDDYDISFLRVGYSRLFRDGISRDGILVGYVSIPALYRSAKMQLRAKRGGGTPL